MNNKGMAAIITVIILGALMVLIGSVMTLTSISEGQSTLNETKVKDNQFVLDACGEEALITINENNTLPSTVITNYGSCNMTLNSHVGSSWDFDLSTSGDMSSLGVNIVLNRGSTIVVSSWIDQ